MSLKIILLAAAAISFALAALKVQAPVDFVALGFCLVTLSLIV